MSTAGSDSSMDMGSGPISLEASAHSDGLPPAGGADGAVWLDGDVLACACPGCGAPMSIRLWLLVADCFRCGASIGLSEEQEQEALRLLRRQEEAKRTNSRRAAAAISPSVLRKPKPVPKPPSRSPSKSVSAAATATLPQRPRRVAASRVHRGARAHVRDIYKKGGLAVCWSRLLKDLPAWLVSLVVHLVALLLLGLWVQEPPDDSESITLSTSVSYEDLEGDQGRPNDPPDAFEFEGPGAVELLSHVHAAGASSEPLDLEPVEVPLRVADPMGRLPDSVVRSMPPLPPSPTGRMFAGRDPKVRAHVVKQAGGTSYTEAAVARGLKFLARHQNENGSWSLHNFHWSPDCDETCTAAGYMHNDTAATALSLLPFLGAGQTHQQGLYTEEVAKGLTWLVERQTEYGDLRGNGPRISRMYAHAQAAIVLSEAYALSGDEQLREPAQAALDFIVEAQHKRGGWRYEPGEPADTSVVGWQLMALKSGQMAYLLVSPEAFELAGEYLDRAQTDRVGGRYAYQPGHRHTEAMTAEALLCRQYLGWPKDHPGLKSGVKYLLREHFPHASRPNIYYWYYATQVMHHIGGGPWREWNTSMSRTLVELQRKRGHAAGSWAPRGRGNPGGHADVGGRIYMTSLAICILEVYYRHMPLYGEDVLRGFP